MQLDIVSALFLGLVQGFTEWLPISSSGHLVLVQTFLGLEVPAEFDIVIMLGTTLALVIYFRKKIARLAEGLARGEKESLEYTLFIAIAGIFTAIVGVAGKRFFKGLFGEPVIVSLLIVATGVFLLIASRKGKFGGRLGYKKAGIVGLAQGLAVAPGISRSGSTIGAAMLLGIKPKEAAEFSFLIGAPAMAIASVVEFLGAEQAGIELPILAAGTATAFIAGYAGIAFFMRILEQGKLAWFGYYCVLVGALSALVLSTS
ncbi:MAG: undecaprenyl-diphosphate phosphatase [Candidatus Micrarchaeota archaeon]